MKNIRLIKAVLSATRILGMLGAFFLAMPASAASLATTQVLCPPSGSWSLPSNGSSTCNDGLGTEAVALLGPTAGYVPVGSAPAAAAWGRNDTVVNGQTVLNWTESKATVTYYFDVTSPVVYPAYTGPVPVLIDAQLTAGVAGGFLDYNMADAYIYLNYQQLQSACSGSVNYSAFCNKPSASLHSYLVNLSPGTENSVTLTAQIQLNSNSASSAYAYADPIIQIDPAFLSAHPGFSLTFSPNLGTVPLPAAAWLFGSGLLGLVGVARRKGRA